MRKCDIIVDRYDKNYSFASKINIVFQNKYLYIGVTVFMNIFSLSKSATLVLIYGLYAVLCHSVAVIIVVTESTFCTSEAIAIKYAPMLEYSVMSLVLILAGALLIEITVRDIQKHNKK